MDMYQGAGNTASNAKKLGSAFSVTSLSCERVQEILTQKALHPEEQVLHLEKAIFHYQMCPNCQQAITITLSNNKGRINANS